MARGPREWSPELKRLKTKAKDNHGYEYDVFLELSKQAKKWVLVIGDTPGHWYMSTLLESQNPLDQIDIDTGQRWRVINFRDIMNEAIGKI